MSSLKDKMYQYEVAPPAHVWDRIANALDEEEEPAQFPARLHNMEVTPPLGVWDKIQQELDAPAEPVQMNNRPAKISTFFRYAAAAIFIGAIAFGIIRFTGNSRSEDGQTAQQVLSKDSVVPGAIIAPPAENPTAKTQLPPSEQSDEAALEQSKKMLASLDRPSRVKRMISSVTPDLASLRYSKDPNDNLSENLYAYEDHVPSIAERYIVLMTPDGNFIRMAKKWGSLLCCVSGEEQDADCKDQLKKWQEKIANSPIAPAPGNFMDILSLVNSLSDDTQL